MPGGVLTHGARHLWRLAYRSGLRAALGASVGTSDSTADVGPDVAGRLVGSVFVGRLGTTVQRNMAFSSLR